MFKDNVIFVVVVIVVVFDDDVEKVKFQHVKLIFYKIYRKIKKYFYTVVRKQKRYSKLFHVVINRIFTSKYTARKSVIRLVSQKLIQSEKDS